MSKAKRPSINPIEIRSPINDKLQNLIGEINSENIYENLNPLIHQLIDLLLFSYKKELPFIREQLIKLKDNSSVIDILFSIYDEENNQNVEYKLLILSILGQLQYQSSLEKFVKIVKTENLQSQLSEKNSKNENSGCSFLNSEDYVEMLRIKAVHCIGFIKTKESFKALEDLIKSNLPISIKIASIDTYSWNSEKSEETNTYFKELLKNDPDADTLLCNLDKPRFHRGIDPVSFRLRMLYWREKWHNIIDVNLKYDKTLLNLNSPKLRGNI